MDAEVKAAISAVTHNAEFLASVVAHLEAERDELAAELDAMRNELAGVRGELARVAHVVTMPNVTHSARNRALRRAMTVANGAVVFEGTAELAPERIQAVRDRLDRLEGRGVPSEQRLALVPTVGSRP